MLLPLKSRFLQHQETKAINTLLKQSLIQIDRSLRL
jgi:hypothetical protein